MKTLQQAVERVSAQVREHCRARGYTEGPWLNPLVPVDCLSAWAMARYLAGAGEIDHYLAVAPEGHVYGFFFEKLGVRMHSVFVDYPPRRCEAIDDLSEIRDGHVLVIEDDVVSGVSLKLVMDQLQLHAPRLVSLYLGRERDGQQLDNVPPGIADIYLAEERLDPNLRAQYETDFLTAFREDDPA